MNCWCECGICTVAFLLLTALVTFGPALLVFLDPTLNTDQRTNYD